MLDSRCPGCAASVAVLEGLPIVTASGGVELWHVACHGRPSAAVVPAAPVVVKRRRGLKIGAGAGAAAVAAFVAFVAWPRAAHTKPTPVDTELGAAPISFDVRADEPVAVSAHAAAADDAPPSALTPEQRYEIPAVDGQSLVDQFPSLADWTHPVTGTVEKMPEQASRHFGAARVGITPRPECGAGHCGIDLDGPRGRSVVAVADGVVVRVERHEFGLDGRSGRYVRIEHDDGTLTSYMHLDDVAEGLEVGDRVDGGQYIGTLGASAVYESVPHLHFSLELPNHPGTHGDNTDTHYVDAAPFLVRAHVAPDPDRRRGVKPAS